MKAGCGHTIVHLWIKAFCACLKFFVLVPQHWGQSNTCKPTSRDEPLLVNNTLSNLFFCVCTPHKSTQTKPHCVVIRISYSLLELQKTTPKLTEHCRRYLTPQSKDAYCVVHLLLICKKIICQLINQPLTSNSAA